MASYDYDLFVIGGGSGGVRAARVTAGLGKRVAIAEEFRYGGTCVIRGCVPKKLYVYASQFPEHFADAAGYGWTVPEASFDWRTLVANKEREISRLEGLYQHGVEKAGGEAFHSRAVLVDAHTVRIEAKTAPSPPTRSSSPPVAGPIRMPLCPDTSTASSPTRLSIFQNCPRRS